jgi:hypothetical protein
MLHGRRPTFSLEGPFVALRELMAGEKTFQRGDRVDLRALGFRDDQIESLWSSFYVDCVPQDGKTALRAQPPPAKGPAKRPRAPERA